MGDLNSSAEEVGTLDCIVFEGDKEPEVLLNGDLNNPLLEVCFLGELRDGDLNKDGACFLGAPGDSIFSFIIAGVIFRIFVGLSTLTSGIW